MMKKGYSWFTIYAGSTSIQFLMNWNDWHGIILFIIFIILNKHSLSIIPSEIDMHNHIEVMYMMVKRSESNWIDYCGLYIFFVDNNILLQSMNSIDYSLHYFLANEISILKKLLCVQSTFETNFGLSSQRVYIYISPTVPVCHIPLVISHHYSNPCCPRYHIMLWH